jgi:glucose/arabinose dehydrogenase
VGLLLVAAGGLAGFLLLAGDEEPSAVDQPATTTTAVTTTTAAITTSTTTPITTTTTEPETDVLGPFVGLTLEPLVSDLFSPVYATAPAGDERVFIVQRTGLVAIVDPERGLLAEPFLDIRDRIDADSGIELGLLGMAFHPDYADNGRFFVYYTDRAKDSVLAEFGVTDLPNIADPASARILLTVDQVGLRHRAGMIQFGPDGYLWLSLGDGAQHDVNPQNLATLQGSILRIDVDGEAPYAIPAGNPFAGGGGSPEIWAYGLRNPWRFSIDSGEELIYIADVGQEDWEEINVLPLASGGANLGWPNMEGTHCFLVADCETPELTLPVLEYAHDEGCSITGGFVYRGAAIPELLGHYFYADWCGGWLRSFRYLDGLVTQQDDWSDDIGTVGSIASFGVDGKGELLLITSDTGIVARITVVRE